MDQEANAPRTIAVDIYQEADGSYCATIGGGYITTHGASEYGAAIDAIDQLLSGLAGIASTREHLKALQTLRGEVAQRLYTMESDAVRDLLPMIERAAKERYPDATVVFEPAPYSDMDPGLWVFLDGTDLDPASLEAYRWTTEIEDRCGLRELDCYCAIQDR